MSLGVVIPTLNAAASLQATLDAIEGAPVDRVLVVDGGSTDATPEIAGARLVTAPRGRGRQLGAGARAIGTDWMLFLHADTRPGPGWRETARGFMADPANRARAGYFRLRLDSDHPEARRLERVVAWRCRRFGLPYGDQGLLLHRDLYAEAGGFAPVPLMEDVALVRRIGRHRLAALEAEAITSAERYERDGWLRRPARNLACLGLYLAGMDPARIARIYR
ncbi:MAG: TIGR04283 family arsenosugar biosynthesis glycosyltransferase [Pseudomonadota bacterium]|nr:TIGR04283 family arsenosugar biosynthesis glycosyltransferase [Pseudomonadota bacterium]